MATIKRKSNGKIITKNGKVSCTCCEEFGCCMYPAQALFDGLYTYEDLPDTVVQVSSDVPPVVTVFTKLSSPQTGTGAGAPGVPTTYFLGIDSNSNNETVGIGIYSNDDEGPNSGPTWKGTEVSNESSQYGACLFAPIFNDPLDYFSLEDQFADTYTVNADLEFPWEEQGNPITIPVNGFFSLERVSLCQWVSSGFPTNAPFFVLNYVNLPPSENPMLEEGPQWALSVYFLEYDPGLFASTVQFKNEPQNSPVGFYGTGIYGTASIS